MAGHALTVASTLACPHGGSVQIASANTRTKASGAFAATATDTFTIAACPFQIPAAVPIPSPCVTVLWLVPDVRVRVNGTPTLSRSSAGLCLSPLGVPQGPVVVQATQVRGRTQ